MNITPYFRQTYGLFIRYQWRIQGGPPAHPLPPTAQKFLDFMQFWGNFDKNICWRPPPDGRRPLLWGILDPLLGTMPLRLI